MFLLLLLPPVHFFMLSALGLVFVLLIPLIHLPVMTKQLHIGKIDGTPAVTSGLFLVFLCQLFDLCFPLFRCEFFSFPKKFIDRNTEFFRRFQFFLMLAVINCLCDSFLLQIFITDGNVWSIGGISL